MLIAPGQCPPEQIRVKRSDAVYNAHQYLTKVPVSAIQPFIEAYTEPGGTVLDPFAGSGMTGVAAAMVGRRAVLSDVSVLGRHVGTNYVNLVDPGQFRQAAGRALARASARLGRVYQHACTRCVNSAELSRRVWSVVVRCGSCAADVNFYRSLERAGSRKSHMVCTSCDGPISSRNQRVGEEPVLDTVSCGCRRNLFDQAISEPLGAPPLVSAPDVAITPDRQMYQASALARNKLESTAAFFSTRNLAALTCLHEAILQEPDDALRNKLLFAFTAILTRASKRYQWSRQRPLNAANQNYYVAPVFYEWNVFDLYQRKVEAAVRSDCMISTSAAWHPLGAELQVEYLLASADALPLADESIDYVFTDPPFGSNIFYSDMNLFQEAWLGAFTNHSLEVVVDRSGDPSKRRTAERYEQLLVDALRECHRVLKPNGHFSLVFSNSSGKIWALLQRAIRSADFTLEPDGVSLLDKGQRSVKGLNSGFEDVVTTDLILTTRKRHPTEHVQEMSPGEWESLLADAVLAGEHLTPSHVYLNLVRECLRRHWDLTPVSFGRVVAALRERGYQADAASGRFLPT